MRLLPKRHFCDFRLLWPSVTTSCSILWPQNSDFIPFKWPQYVSMTVSVPGYSIRIGANNWIKSLVLKAETRVFKGNVEG